VPLEIRRLIREMSLANPLWGAPRVHGELLKLGIAIGQTSVAKYMTRGRGPPSQGWRTFLRNHADGIAAMDLFVVPTISFRLLYGLLILRHQLKGWTVRKVIGGTVVLEGPNGIRNVRRGDKVSGLGKIEDILRWGKWWIVATERGLISTQ